MIYDEDDLRSKIHIIRNRQVMIDRDLAAIYGVETRRLNEQVKRNTERFPEDFCFQLNDEEFGNWKSQNATSNSDRMGLRKNPYAFTEQGVAMLASVLKTKTAVDASVKIVRAFVAMRHFIMNNAKIFVEIQDIKNHLIESDIHHKENDRKIEQLFSLMEQSDKEVNEGLFYNGQIFDSYNFISDLIRKAKKEIILIDNYIDDSVLKILNKREENVLATIYTSRISENLKLDIDKHNSQYSPINIQIFKKFYDRFLIIDNDVYHIGASFKDLGKSVFAFSKMGIGKEKILLIM
ncbi:MAG: ORF6N domain-containing protein [Bacteroidales bacterium]|nr:ORF6N domain-containing protein [Bacteroidales bacterium]